MQHDPNTLIRQELLTPESTMEGLIADLVRNNGGSEDFLISKSQLIDSVDQHIHNHQTNDSSMLSGLNSQDELPFGHTLEDKPTLDNEVIPDDLFIGPFNPADDEVEIWLANELASGSAGSDDETSLTGDNLYFDTLIPAGEKSASAAVTDEIIRLSKAEADLAEAREKVASLFVKVSGKISSKRNQELNAEYSQAVDEYGTAVVAANSEKIENLRTEGNDDDIIAAELPHMNTEEHILLTEATRIAKRDSRQSGNKYINFLAEKGNQLAASWANKGSVKRALWSGGAGSAATVVAGGLVAVTGVGAAVAGISLLSVKAAKSLGLYKVNKGSRAITEFDRKAEQDRQAIFQLENTDDLNVMAVSSGNIMAQTLKNRVERDQQENRRRLVFAVGAVAVGAAVGSLVHDLTQREGLGHRLARDRQLPVPKSSVPTSTVLEQTPVTTLPRVTTTPPAQQPTVTTVPRITDSAPKPIQTTDHTRPINHDYGTQEPPVRAPVDPAETPVSEPITSVETPAPVVASHPEVDTSQMTWTVANEISPGNEGQLMQGAITRFNVLNNSNFALTPHNGSTWIIDNGRSINPAQMAELNKLMLEDDLLIAA